MWTSSGRQLSACAMDLVGSEGARSPIETRAVFVGHPHRRGLIRRGRGRAPGASPGTTSDASSCAVGYRTLAACGHRDPSLAPPRIASRCLAPRARQKLAGSKTSAFLTRVPNFSQRNRAVARCHVVDWTRSGTRRNQRVRSSRPLASRQLRSSKKGRATTTSPLNDQCLRRPRRPRPFQDFTQPSSRVPSRRTHPDPRVPRGVHTAPARHAAREPPSGGFSVEGTRPAKQGFQTPKRTAAYPARAPRVGARRPPNDGADVRQSGVHPRSTSQTAPPRPQLAPARSLSAAPTPKRSPPSKANIPKTKRNTKIPK